MKMITAIIKPHKLDCVRESLANIDIQGITVTEVRGFGRQKGHTEFYRGAEHAIDFVPKVKLEIAISTDKVDLVIDTISNSAKSEGEGKIGDGKIFISNLEQIIRIRTGETGSIAL